MSRKEEVVDHNRHLGILSPDEILFPVTVIGCGGIGSHVIPVLAKLGCSQMTIYDPDTVEPPNVPVQFFREEDIKKLKVEATQDITFQLSGLRINIIPEIYAGQPIEGIVISGVDEITEREKIWEFFKYNPEVLLYIDGRLGGELMQVFTVRPSQIEDVEAYEKSLFSKKEAAQLPCTAKSIIYTPVVLAGIISSQVKKWVKEESYYRRITLDLKTTTFIPEDEIRQIRGNY